MVVVFVTLYFDLVDTTKISVHRIIVASEKNSVVDYIAVTVDNMFKDIKYKGPKLLGHNGTSYNQPLVRVGNFDAVTSNQVKAFHQDSLFQKMRSFIYPGVPGQMIVTSRFSTLHIATARAIFTTIDSIMTALRPFWYRGGGSKIPFMFLDEGSNVSRLEILIAALLPIEFVGFFGDVKKLGVFGLETLGEDGAFAASHLELFDKLSAENTAHRLTKNYRSVPELIAFPSKFTYDDALEATRLVCSTHSDKLPSYRIVDFRASREERGLDYQETDPSALWNPAEGLFLLRLVDLCLRKLYGSDVTTWLKKAGKTKIAILTPYHGQIDYINRMIAEQYRHLIPLLVVSTVDGSQGCEYHLVFASLVRTHSMGFLADPRRML